MRLASSDAFVEYKHTPRRAAENLPTDTFSQLQPNRVQLAKTASRSTLDFMNEMGFELRYSSLKWG
jgi:hypothetical protein